MLYSVHEILFIDDTLLIIQVTYNIHVVPTVSEKAVTESLFI